MCHEGAGKSRIFGVLLTGDAPGCLRDHAGLYGLWTGLFIDRRKRAFL